MHYLYPRIFAVKHIFRNFAAVLRKEKYFTTYNTFK